MEEVQDLPRCSIDVPLYNTHCFSIETAKWREIIMPIMRRGPDICLSAIHAARTPVACTHSSTPLSAGISDHPLLRLRPGSWEYNIALLFMRAQEASVLFHEDLQVLVEPIRQLRNNESDLSSQHVAQVQAAEDVCGHVAEAIDLLIEGVLQQFPDELSAFRERAGNEASSALKRAMMHADTIGAAQED
jgi:hypothetical protein